MLKKAVLMVFMAMLIAFGATASYAYQIDGLADDDGPTPLALIEAYINPGGLGDALIYSYFNVRGNLNLFNIVNTSTTDGVKVRVVFREARDSKEVLDFSVCLSKGDVWTAYLADDGTAGHIYGGVDTDTITAPEITSSGQQFKYGSANSNKHNDGTSITADDTREGYFEVLSLSIIPGYDKNASSTSDCPSSAPSSESRNCIRSATACANWGASTYVTPAPENVLHGNNTIFELATLGTYSSNAAPFADAVQVPILDPGPGDELSLFEDATIGCRANAIMSKHIVIAPYDIMSSIGGETELIMTFPARKSCNNTTGTMSLFNGSTYTDSGATRYKFCAGIGVDVWNDKEQKQSVLDFSPAGALCLPYEVNVIRVGGSAIWNTAVGSTISAGSYQLGWVRIALNPSSNHVTNVCSDGTLAYYGGSPSSCTTTVLTAYGLPVLPYITQSFLGSAATYMTPAAYVTSIIQP